MLIGTVCHIGTFDHTKNEFKQDPHCSMGTVTRSTMLKICGIEDPDELTDKVVNKNLPDLQAALLPKLKRNLVALENQLHTIGSWSKELRLFRISSNLLPLYDHEILGALYTPAINEIVDTHLMRCKYLIDTIGIRVCTHPDQYTVINSESKKTRTQAYRSLYMHKRFMEKLTTSEQTCINVHLNGNLDHLPELDKGMHKDLIPWLSFENEDKRGRKFVGDVANTLAVCEKYGIKMVLDLHHHYVLSGKRLPVYHPYVKRIRDTWRGERPIAHLSQGREFQRDFKHSGFIDDWQLIGYSTDFREWFDIEIEAKFKHEAVERYAAASKNFLEC